MVSEPVRDPITDHLLTPQNSALLVIDYQPSQVQTVASIDHDVLIDNIVSVARLATTYDLPVVLSTVNVAGGQQPTIPELKAALPDSTEIDRTRELQRDWARTNTVPDVVDIVLTSRLLANA